MGVPQVKIPQKEHVFRWAPQARADSVSQYLEASEVNQPPPSPVSFCQLLETNGLDPYPTRLVQ